jgi:hypothetical protein
MNKLGIWSASLYFLLGAVYAITVAVGMSRFGLQQPIRGPILEAMELLTLVGAPLLLLVIAAVHASASPSTKAFGSAALGFAIIAVGLTCSVHFVGLTALRQIGAVGLSWPSPLYALELLAWDVFFGLSLLFAAPVLQGPSLARTTRLALRVTGSLCLAGTVGPLTGDMRFQFIAVAGYGLLLPATCLLLAKWFQKPLIA